MKKTLLHIFFLVAVCGALSAQQPQTIKLTQLETAKTVESSKAGQIGLTNSDGKQRYAQYVEIDLTPIAFVPTATGNTANYSEFVTDPNGDKWYIDWQGRGYQFPGGGGTDKNGYYGGNGGNGGDDTIPSVTRATLTNQLTHYTAGSDLLGFVPVRIQSALSDTDDQDFFALTTTGDSLYFFKQDNSYKIYSSLHPLQVGSAATLDLIADSIRMQTVPNNFTGERTFLTQSPGGYVTKQEGIGWEDLLQPVKDSIDAGGGNGIYGGSGDIPDNTNASIAVGGAFGFSYSDGVEYAIYISEVNNGVGIASDDGFTSANINDLDLQLVSSDGATDQCLIDITPDTLGISTNGGYIHTIYNDGTVIHRIKTDSLGTTIASDNEGNSFKVGGSFGGLRGRYDSDNGNNLNIENSDGTAAVFQTQETTDITNTETGSGDVAQIHVDIGDDAALFYMGNSGAFGGTYKLGFDASIAAGKLIVDIINPPADEDMLIADGGGFEYISKIDVAPVQSIGSTTEITAVAGLLGAYTLQLANQGATSGQVLTFNGTDYVPQTPGGGSGTVTTVSVVSANGLAGTVATATTTPAITLSTSVTGIVKGNGTAFSAATVGTDYSVGTSALATGILKSTTGTGALSIGVPGTDFGDINNGGNSTGATVVVGTNDAQSFSIETNNVIRETTTGGASTGGAKTNTDVTSNTNSVETMFTEIANSSGTAATGFGLRHLYQLESSTTDAQDAASIGVLWADATHATRMGDIVFSNQYNGTGLVETFRIAGNGGAVTASGQTVLTNAVQTRYLLNTNSTGTASAGFGGIMKFRLESSTTVDQDAGGLTAFWTTATHASRTSAFLISAVNNAGALGEVVRFQGATAPAMYIAATMGSVGSSVYTNAGITAGVSYTVGGSASALTLGGSSGTVSITSTAASAGAINVAPATGNNAGSVYLAGGLTATNASGTRRIVEMNTGIAPTSGTGIFSILAQTGTINQTGGANGVTNGIFLDHTITAAADFRALEIATNSASAWAVYQSGSSSPNTFVGKTAFGSVTAPTEAVTVTGNISLTTPGNKMKIATGSNASLGTSTLVAGTVTVNTTAVATGSTIMLCHNTPGGTQGILSYGTIVNATSFVITSNNAADTSTVNWWILN